MRAQGSHRDGQCRRERRRRRVRPDSFLGRVVEPLTSTYPPIAAGAIFRTNVPALNSQSAVIGTWIFYCTCGLNSSVPVENEPRLGRQSVSRIQESGELHNMEDNT